MRFPYIFLYIILFGMAMMGCDSYSVDGETAIETKNDNNSVITMVTQRTDGIISLAIDAATLNRFGVWIDLNGDKIRAKNGSEDVKIFNVYQEYTVAAGVKSIHLYGDITYLGAASNALGSIDISGNPFLNTLNLPLNELITIDLSANTTLKKVDLSGNKISTLDLSSNTLLESLWVFNNQLSSLDISNNANLSFLDCSGNNLSTLNITNNQKLVRLLAYNNQLTAVDISNNMNLNRVWLYGNPLSETEVARIESTLNGKIVGEVWITDEPLHLGVN